LLQQIAINTVCINIFILGIHDVFLGRWNNDLRLSQRN
jgi:hypothetical protein